MKKLKYADLIKYDPKPNARPPVDRPNAPPADIVNLAMYMDQEYLKGAFYTEVCWIMKAYPDKVWARPHVHDWDEMITFWGSDPAHPKELNGEIELWLEDEKYLLTKSCLIYVPKGMKHCPLISRRVDKPIFHFTCGPSGMYTDTLVNP